MSPDLNTECRCYRNTRYCFMNTSRNVSINFSLNVTVIQQKMTRHSDIFIKAVYFKCSKKTKQFLAQFATE